MLRLILYAFLLFIGYRVCKWALNSFKTEDLERLLHRNNENVTVDDLVKDPVCGVYVPVKSAFSANKDGKKVYFCSENCRDRYLNE